MPFYQTDPALAAAGERLIDDSLAECPGVPREAIAVTWIVHPEPPRHRLAAPWSPAPRGFGWRGDVPIYPASVVKLFHMVAMFGWRDAGLLTFDAEDRRALKAMIGISSNDATAYIVDRLTEAPDGGPLAPEALALWEYRRGSLDRYFQAWGWPELAGSRVCHKTYDEGCYGREALYRGRAGMNLLSTDGVARMVYALAAQAVMSPALSQEMFAIMARDLRRDGPERSQAENQVDEFLGQDLPEGTLWWSKAGWTSSVRHDAGHLELPDGRAATLAVFTTGGELSRRTDVLPAFGRNAVRLLRELPMA
ncbi:MAG TPA: serine hydrolase [Alphaproteobacteria bacterium]|nr:serine hydrolase [Alphaproteobacteria bacterium]